MKGMDPMRKNSIAGLTHPKNEFRMKVREKELQKQNSA